MDLTPKKSSRTPKKSLAIPNKTPPDDYKAYVEHPEVATLNQVMLHYLDIEEILKLYSQNHEQFETRQALDTLAQRFNLPKARSFKRLLKSYDMKYATVRSYLYNNRTPRQILMNAAFEGNIQAFYNQFKLYPDLRNEGIYYAAIASAAQGGNEAIIKLLFQLGARGVGRSVLFNAARGGQLELVLKELAKGFKSEDIEVAVSYAASNQQKAVLAVLLDSLTNDQILTEAMDGVGVSGDNSIIEYVISRGGRDYSSLIRSAAAYGHFDIVRQYWDKLTVNDTEFNDSVFQDAAKYADLATVKFLVERTLVSPYQLKTTLREVKSNLEETIEDKQLASGPHELERLDNRIAALASIIAYLESVGVEEFDSSSESSSSASESSSEDSSSTSESSSDGGDRKRRRPVKKASKTRKDSSSSEDSSSTSESSSDGGDRKRRRRPTKKASKTHK